MVQIKKFHVIGMALIVVMFLFPISNALAGSDTPAQDEKEKVTVPFLTFGGTDIDVDAMNKLMTPKGYRRFKDYSFIMGGGFYKKVGRSILEFEIRGIRWNTRKRGNKQSSLGGINGLIHYGFNVLPQGPITLFPYVGGGFGKLWLGLTKTSTPLDSLLAQPVTDIKLEQKTFILDAGIGFDVTITRKRTPDKNPITIGIRTGYSYDPTDNRDWYENDTAIKGGPKLSLSGPYARLILGKSIKRPWQGKNNNDEKI